MPFDGRKPLSKQQIADLKILRLAREGIATPGLWCQAHMEVDGVDGQITRCALGWLIFAADDNEKRAYAIATQYFNYMNPCLYMSVVNYNDAASTTQADMVELFDRVIVSLER